MNSDSVLFIKEQGVESSSSSHFSFLNWSVSPLYSVTYVVSVRHFLFFGHQDSGRPLSPLVWLLIFYQPLRTSVNKMWSEETRVKVGPGTIHFRTRWSHNSASTL